MVAARTRLDIASSNLANVSTDGFRRAVARGVLGRSGVTILREASPEHGGLQRTERDFDLALVGDGAFTVRDPNERLRSTRDGRFTRERDGTLRDVAGGTLLGAANRALHLPDGARIDERGRVVARSGAVLDRLPLQAGTTVHAGYLESSSVNAVAEMVGVLAAERSFESAQKIVTAIDATREKSAETARIK